MTPYMWGKDVHDAWRDRGRTFSARRDATKGSFVNGEKSGIAKAWAELTSG